MIPPGLNNPFQTHKLDSTLKLPPGHVPELQEPALKKCREVVAQTRHLGHGVGLFVQGEAGSGKSHLIAQLRDQFAKDPNAVLISVRMGGAFAGRLWRHIRQAMASELLWRYPGSPAEPNGLSRILCRRFPDWVRARRGATSGLLDFLLGFNPGKDLQPYLKQFSDSCDYPLNYKLQQVLAKLTTEKDTHLAQAWLATGQLGDKDLKSLDLPLANATDEEQETEAREVVLSFLRLAGDKVTLFLCFDQIEAIQTGAYDSAVLRQFTAVVTELLAEEGPRVVATFIRPSLLVQMTKAASDGSDIKKIGQEQTIIPPLTLDQTTRLVLARLDTEPGCHAARRQHPADRFWPLGQQFIETLYQKNRRSLTPRHLIMECSAEFKRLQAGGGETAPRVVENGGSAIEASNDEDELPPDWTDRLQMAWQQQRDRYLATHQGISFDTVMALGLPWLTRLRKVPLVEVKDLDKRLGDVNLRFQPIAPGSAAVGISFCNHDPRSYWRRLDRLLKQWNAAREGKLLGQLIILRSAAERTTESGETRVKELRKAGVRVILVERQALAEMAAFQWLLTTSLKGDLTWSGKILDASKYDDWAKENVSGAVKEFFDEVFDLHGLTRSLSALNVSTPAGTPPPAPSGSQPKGGKTATARK